MKKYLLLIYFMILVCAGYAQERVVKGKVTSSEDGSALPGVNVVVKGTTIGSVTDIDGNYSISVPADATLIFSFIGFETQEVNVGARSVVDIQLGSDIKQLSEVVVTAQGIEKTRNELSYAAQQVDGEKVSANRDANFVNALSGRVAGLDIKRNNSMGGSSNVVIRGSTSLAGNNQALFIIDGVPVDNTNNNNAGPRMQATGRGGYDYGNAAADINPDDIASINVLKGAAATALYGSRAANGVILITTKKGRKKNGIGVTVNTGFSYGVIDKKTFAEYQDKYGGGYGLYYEDPTGYFLYRDASSGFDVPGSGPDLVVPTSEDASWGAPFDPNLMVYQWDAFDASSPYYGKARPWVAAKNDPTEFFENPRSQNNSILIDGKGDKGYFKLGYTRNEENGLLPNGKLDKDYINFGASYEIMPKLTANASVNLTSVDGRGRYGTGYDDKNPMTNFRQWWQVNVDIKELKEAYFRNHENVTWNWADPSDLSPIYWDNPYFSRYENYENDSRLRYFGYTGLDYKLADWINITGRISLDSYREKQEERQAVGSTTLSSYSVFERAFREYNYDLLVNFNKELNDNFKLSGVLGTNTRKTRIESIYGSTNGGLALPRLYSLSNSVSPINAPLQTFEELKVIGLFANANVGFNDLLFLDLAIRRDESSSLPEGENVFYYPSISTSFVFSELIGPTPVLTGAKLRANYAEVGNTAPALSLADYYTNTNPYKSSAKYSIPGTKNNPNLKPELTKSYEIGLEMTFFDGRVGFDATYYNQRTQDQIVPIPVSKATGYDFKYINAGEMENRGVELMVFGTPVKTANFSWNVNVNFTRNRNEVLSLPEGIQNLQLGSYQGGVTINAALGEPYGTIRGTDFVYDENGNKIVGANGLYLQSSTSNEIIGNANPDWTGGISNTLSYKGLSLGFLVDVRQGGDVFSLDMHYGLATGLYPETAGLNDLGNPLRAPLSEGGGVILDGVKEDGSVNDKRVSAQYFGLFGYRRNPNAAFVYDASYVKLREVTLTYSLPESIISSIGFVNGIDLSLVGRNLWIIHKNMPYADPEEGLGAGNLASGYQVGAYPSVKNMGFNLKVKF